MVRHAEVHNPRDIVYGRLPRFRLSTRGQEQAVMVARFLSVRSIDVVYTSPLLRARETAATIARYHPGVRMRVARGLIEVKTSYQGQPNSILKPGFSFYEPRLTDGDETMAMVRDRMLSVLQSLALRHAGGAAVAVSHADPITILRMGLEGAELDTPHLHSTLYAMRSSVTQIVIEPGRPLGLAYFDVADEGTG